MKITTKKRLQKALKIGAVALAALVLLVLLVGVGVSCIKDRYKNRELITCAAEETNATTEDTRTIYPSENLIPYPYESRTKTVCGITFLDNDDGTITINGQNDGIGFSTFSLSSKIRFIAGESYCLVGDFIILAYSQNDKINYVLNRINFIWGSDWVFVGLYLQVNKGDTTVFNNFVVKPMLNVGDVAYPFIPNLDGVRQDGYNNGYDIGRQDGNEKGYENGYEDGYGAGVEDSVFFGVSVTAALQKLDGSYEKAYTASPRKSSETFDFGFLTDYFKRNYTEGNYMACSLSLTFEKPVPYYTYLFEMHDLSGALAQLCTVVAEDGMEYTKFRFSRQEGKTGQLEYWGDNIETLKTLKIKQIKDIYLSFPLFDFSPFQSLSMTYKDVAYENGYAIGKQEGEDNAVFTFDNLKSGFFSIVDAPFKAIKDALNFEFLGINISNLVLFLLTVIVVVIIIKKAVGK